MEIAHVEITTSNYLYLHGHDSEAPMVANGSLFLVLFDYGGERGKASTRC
jgi:hypothetical protein